jgi:hypothetical protein
MLQGRCIILNIMIGRKKASQLWLVNTLPPSPPGGAQTTPTVTRQVCPMPVGLLATHAGVNAGNVWLTSRHQLIREQKYLWAKSCMTGLHLGRKLPTVRNAADLRDGITRFLSLGFSYSDFLAIFCLRKMTYQSFINSRIWQSAIALAQ